MGDSNKGMNVVTVPPTKCVSAAETRLAYLDLVGSGACTDRPCLRDACVHCGPVMQLVDDRGQECEDRGCTPARCIYDD